MSTLLRTAIVLLALSAAALPALAYPEHTIYVDTSHNGGTDSGPIDSASWDEVEPDAR